MRNPRAAAQYIYTQIGDRLGWTDDVVWEKFIINGLACRFDTRDEVGGQDLKNMYSANTSSSERDQLADLLSRLHRDDVFYDIGAHLGFYSVFAAKYLTEGNAYLFEPYPPNVEQLKRNLELNDLSANVYEVALSDENGMMTVRVPSHEYTGMQMLSLSDNGEEVINTFRGDEIIEREDLSPPNAVKIDVEGAEPLVVDGLENTLAREDCRLLSVEVHLPSENSISSIRDHGWTIQEFESRIQELGFDIVKTNRRDTEVHLLAEKR
ncbi:FkbM family methyltransferase [Haloarcula litorea]|uniref:FkbM family methyltransferase n=1 Tax=Haloarcula litorea TaxID=3032579 RepID=UPI0023E860B9|nr:FkbM family methyltransferase [Halomicroarcula sp. GDY20]